MVRTSTPLFRNTRRFIVFIIGFLGLGCLTGLSFYLEAPDNVQLVLAGGSVACALIALSGLSVLDKAKGIVGAWSRGSRE